MPPGPVLQIPPRLYTERLMVTLPEPADAAHLHAYDERNREYLAPFSPPAPEGSRDLQFWQDYVGRVRDEFVSGRAVRMRLSLRAQPDAGFVGAAALSEICRGAMSACYLGYHMDAAYAGQGLMTEALRRVIDYAFVDLRLHRIMANYLPSNRASARVLAKLGFVIEGYARSYLFIGGAWRDHVLTSLTNHALTSPL